MPTINFYCNGKSLLARAVVPADDKLEAGDLCVISEQQYVVRDVGEDRKSGDINIVLEPVKG